MMSECKYIVSHIFFLYETGNLLKQIITKSVKKKNSIDYVVKPFFKNGKHFGQI